MRLRTSFVLRSLFLSILGFSAHAQTPRPQNAAQPPASLPNQPRCSTEKLNSDCFVNINRRYPVTLPTIQMRRKAKLTVAVYNPYAFESLTLDPGPASAYQGNDQASVLLGSIIPIAKGSNPAGVAVQAAPSRNLLDFITKRPQNPLGTT
jgi:hypothetical protein